MQKKNDDMLPRVSMPKGENAKWEYTNISRIAQYISTNSGLVDAEEPFQLVTMPSKNASVSIALKADEGISLSKNITQYDATVMDAVYSLYINGCSCFSPEMIARMVSGDLKKRVSAQKIGAVTKSIKKLRHIDITIDLTDEYRKTGRQIEDDVKIKRKSYLLPLDEFSAVVPDNGKIVKNRIASYKEDGEDIEFEIAAGYSFSSKPVLYTYAEQHGEIEQFPTRLLAAPKLTDTDENTAIKWYLIRRIGALKRAKNKSALKDIIYYDEEDRQGAFSDLWYNKDEYSNWRDKRLKIHKAIVKILDAYKEENYILDYNTLTSGKTVIGVEIIISSEY